MGKQKSTRLYLITPSVIGDYEGHLVPILATGQVACLQLRLKDHLGQTLPTSQLCRVARKMGRICRDYGVVFIINDDVEAAIEVDADGVHLGQDGGDYQSAKNRLGSDRFVGVSCGNSRHLAYEAGEAGVDYVAFGPVFSSLSKPSDRPMVPLDFLMTWKETTNLPSVAIGGITPDRASDLAATGVDYIAVINAIWGADDPVQAVHDFASALDGVD